MACISIVVRTGGQVLQTAAQWRQIKTHYSREDFCCCCCFGFFRNCNLQVFPSDGVTLISRNSPKISRDKILRELCVCFDILMQGKFKCQIQIPQYFSLNMYNNNNNNKSAFRERQYLKNGFFKSLKKCINVLLQVYKAVV